MNNKEDLLVEICYVRINVCYNYARISEKIQLKDNDN